MIESLTRWFKNFASMPSRVLSVLECVHAQDRQAVEFDLRLRRLEQQIYNLPAPYKPDLSSIHSRIDGLHQHLDQLNFLAGRVKCSQLPEQLERLSDAEFKVFSQFGDDGIIEYLVSKLDVVPQVFIEFGVESYIESNTRFLLQNRNWSGLILDGSREDVEWIRRQEFYWRHDLTAVCAFIDAENINSLIAENGFAGQIGLLSIDIDGNDYWVWRAITVVDPIIVVCEFNGTFGEAEAVTVPYTPDFQRTRFHHSNLYWGASLMALCDLADEKGYTFVGCNSAGNNAYFVRNSHVAPLLGLTKHARFIQAKFRESRDAHGALTFADDVQRREIIGDLQVFDLHDLQLRSVDSLPK